MNDHLLFTGRDARDHLTVGSLAAPVGVDHYESLMTLAYVAGMTEHIRLGTAVLVLAFRDPVLLAKQVATLDRLSGGRVILGIGVGGLEGEFSVPGVPFKARGRVTDQHLERIRTLWVAGNIPHAAPADSSGNFLLRPVQMPGPPVWIGGNCEHARRRLLDAGDGWPSWGRPFPAIAGQHISWRWIEAAARC